MRHLILCEAVWIAEEHMENLVLISYAYMFVQYQTVT